MRRLVRAGLVAALLSVVAAPRVSAQSAGPTDGPSLTLSVPAATVGQEVNVSGQRFAPNTAMSMQVCGNDASEGSTDCDVAAGQTVVTDERGEFRSHLNVRFPPVPCPCVVWVTAHNGPTMSATAPIGVIAANYTPPAPDTNPPPGADVEVVRAELVQNAAWRGWFGLPSSARLRVTVRNPGDSTLAHPVLSLNAGRGDDPTGVLDAPQLDSLQPGEERTIEVPISLGPLAHGSYTVKGTIGSTPITFRATTRVFPWGAVTLLVTITLGATLWWIRRRRRDRAEEEPLAPPLAREPDPPNDDLDAVASIILEPEETVTVTRADDDLPQMATDDELVAWGAALVDEANDDDWLTGRNDVDLTTSEEVIVVPDSLDETPVVDVAFALPGYEDARRVVLCGEFNDWSPDATPMQYRSGLWGVIIPLESDRDYRYRFLVNGEQWLDDPFTSRRTPNDFGGHDSVIHTRRADEPVHESRVTAPA